MEQAVNMVTMAVAESTATAAHGRDHDHEVTVECCHPHTVEVIFLGHRAVTVCHDCRADSGFLPSREAEHLAQAHRDETRVASHLLEHALAS